MKTLKYYIKNRNRKGSVLVMFLIIFLIITLLSTSILFLFNTNLGQAKYQEDSLEAYYLAYSGIEMGFAAITANNNQLLNEMKNTPLKKLDSKTDTETQTSNQHIEFGQGYIDILITTSKDDNFTNWIKIESTGTLKKNNQSYKRTLYINPKNQNDVVWKNN